MRPVMKFKVLRLLQAPLLAYAGFCGFVGACQRSLIYHPSRQSESAMLRDAGAERCEPWRASAKAIIGWKSARKAGQPVAPNRLVVFGGNAGCALDRAFYVRGFEHYVGVEKWEVYLFEYPGYGARAGRISESSFIDAGGQALESLAAADSRPVFLLGESLGSGLACALAQRQPGRVAGLFLVTPYARLGDVAARQFSYLPARLMLRDPWDNVAALRGYRGPVAMLIAGQDEVVTAAQGRLLYRGFEGPKHLWTDPDAGHNTIDFGASAPWWREVSDFLLNQSSRRLSPP
jgi:pimeloyl-ACP methyl ester carboxylesterase